MPMLVQRTVAKSITLLEQIGKYTRKNKPHLFRIFYFPLSYSRGALSIPEYEKAVSFIAHDNTIRLTEKSQASVCFLCN